MILKQILFYLGLGHHKFNAKIWKTQINKRSLFAKDIIYSKITIGLNAAEVSKLLGSDRAEFINGVWSYKISSFKKGVTTDGNTKSALILQFDELGNVAEAKIKWFKKK